MDEAKAEWVVFWRDRSLIVEAGPPFSDEHRAAVEEARARLAQAGKEFRETLVGCETCDASFEIEMLVNPLSNGYELRSQVYRELQRLEQDRYVAHKLALLMAGHRRVGANACAALAKV